MNIAVLGATGRLGQRIVEEGLHRGHQITALVRRLSSPTWLQGVQLRQADFRSPSDLEAALGGQHALVSAVGPASGEPASVVVDATRAVAAACMRAGLRRVLVVGGAGSLEVEPGLELLHTQSFPQQWRDIALAHREALELWRKVKELDWTVVSPAASIEPGARTARYRTGHNDLLIAEDGQSRISMEDFAVGVIDELERGAHFHERITFAY